ncbi:MAG TPA: hypothetical protein VGQ58_04600 [Candidatus Limnocylindrales bacterium]|jgi:hypothetical protein|nr:hypothetical protein [Candidatus Limnocylindrales bacterium]
MTYRPGFVRQGDGSSAQWDNCAAATGAMDLDRDTRGAQRTTGAKVRQLTGTTSGGLTLPQIDAALVRGFGPRDHLDVRPKLAWDQAMAHIRAGQGAEVYFSYRPFVGTPYDCFSGRFAGIHAAWANELSADGTKLYWGDPGADGRRSDVPRGFLWVPVSLVRSAAGLYVGAGYVQLGLSRDTEPSYRLHLNVGTRFRRYFLSGGRITRSVADRTAGGFGSTCTAPRLFRFSDAVQARRRAAGLAPLSPRSLVRVTNPKSSRYGWWIASKYAVPIAGTGG